MRQTVFAALLAASMPFGLQAQADGTYDLARTMAALLAAEKPCGLTYSQAAIAAWITANIQPDDLDFAPTLQTLTAMASYSFDDMSASQKTAHCMAVRQSAVHLGLME